VGLGPLVLVKGTLNASADQEILDNFRLPTLWEQFRDGPFLFHHNCTRVLRASGFLGDCGPSCHKIVNKFPPCSFRLISHLPHDQGYPTSCLPLSPTQRLTEGSVAHSSLVQVYDLVPDILRKLFGVAHVGEAALWRTEDKHCPSQHIQEDTGHSIHFFILIPVLLLLLGLGGVIYWRYRGRRRGQKDSQEQSRMKKDEPKTQDDVTYSTVVHSTTPATDEVTYATVVHSSRRGTTPTVTDIGEKSEYATILTQGKVSYPETENKKQNTLDVYSEIGLWGWGGLPQCSLDRSIQTARQKIKAGSKAGSTTTDLEEYTSSVTSYIGKCIDDVTVSKTITTRPNQKPWMTAEVRALLKARDSAFKAGDKAALRKARAKLSRGIREAKRAHGQSIHSHFRDSGDTRRMWQGIQAITNYRTTPPACDSDASLPDALNHFYARFETQNSVAARKTTPPSDDQVLCLTAADVRKTLRRVNPQKAAGPDNIPASVLRECADQLTDVFNDIFNISLSSATVPTCLKATTIIPVSKKSSVSCLHDYRPIGLTPIIMKCFERLVLRHIKTLLPPSLDPLQFAYRPNRSTDDAISTTLHLALTHLDNKDTYVRMFIDFSSAFNTIIPQHLIGKLNLLWGLNHSLSLTGILDFLTGRPQSVRIGRNTSSTTTLSTGAATPRAVCSALCCSPAITNCAAMQLDPHHQSLRMIDGVSPQALIVSTSLCTERQG
ncbi:hypothetical protein NFI96_004702, partial [Prochilodus magdalenae]